MHPSDVPGYRRPDLGLPGREPPIVQSPNWAGDGGAERPAAELVTLDEDRQPASRWEGPRSLFAWTVVVLLIGFQLVASMFVLNEDASEEADQTAITLLAGQAKMMIGAKEMAAQFGSNEEQDFSDSFPPEPASVRVRLCRIIAMGELEGTAKALSLINDLQSEMQKKGYAPNDKEKHMVEELKHVYETGMHVDLDARNKLIKDFGWFGKLLWARADGPNVEDRIELLMDVKRSTTGMMIGVGGFMAAGALGVVGILLILVFLGMGKVSFLAKPNRPQNAVFIETFALWMLTFTGLSIAAQSLLPDTVSLAVRLCWAGVAQFGSLLVLIWPMLTGMSWGDLRREIGLVLPENPLLCPATGMGAYLSMLPFLLAGVIGTAMLTSFAEQFRPELGPFETPQVASHPIVGPASEAAGSDLLWLIFLPVVAAPIVEEIIFRGVLYRHLRGVSRNAWWFTSAVGSALVSSFVFAVIHPQGLTTVPALMGIALGMCLAREMTNSLVPGMIVHAVHNGSLMLLMLVMF